MPAVQDHKRAYEGDKGPNTGGMGSYSQEDGLLPFLRQGGVRTRGRDHAAGRGRPQEGGVASTSGTLYGQFMLTKDGPKVIEFNARFGDPEAMNVLSLLRSDFTRICERMAERMHRPEGRGSSTRKASVCKYVVPQGYGVKSLSGEEIKVDEAAIAREGALLYYASVNEKDGRVFTTTSRSVGVVGLAGSIDEAERIAEKALGHVSGKVFVRHDIAAEADARREGRAHARHQGSAVMKNLEKVVSRDRDGA